MIRSIWGQNTRASDGHRAHARAVRLGGFLAAVSVWLALRSHCDHHHNAMMVEGLIVRA
jgi:hypothetical protein